MRVDEEEGERDLKEGLGGKGGRREGRVLGREKRRRRKGDREETGGEEKRNPEHVRIAGRG